MAKSAATADNLWSTATVINYAASAVKLFTEKTRPYTAEICLNQKLIINLHFENGCVLNVQLTSGVMLEWLKRQTWKVCIPRKGIGSSNLPHSAKASKKIAARSYSSVG